MKKTISLFLALLMAVSMLACGVKTTAAAENADPLTGWIFEEDTSLAGEITLAIPFKGNQGMDAMIAEFNATYPNIKVNLHTYSNNSDGNVALNTAIAAGEVDVVTSFGLSNAYNRWQTGLYMDLTDMVEEDGIDLVANWGTDVYQYEDCIYTFPCGGLSYYIAINMTAWEEAGLGEIPTEWTWEEYMDACAKMTKRGANGETLVYGGSDYHSLNYVMNEYLQVNGGDMYYKPDGTSSFNDPLVLRAMERELQAELVDKIWYPKAVYRGEGQQAQMTFCQGTTASTIICNVTRFLHDTVTYPDVDWITAFAPMPVNEKGQTNYMSGVTPFSHAGIAMNCDQVDAAWAFLKWYSSYGVKYLAVAGHQPNWYGTELGSAVELIYGSEEEAAKWIDVDSFKRVVGVSTNPIWADVQLTAYGSMGKIISEYALYAVNGEMTAEEAMNAAYEDAMEAIENAE